MNDILSRVKIRLPDEPSDILLDELIETAVDRICLRLGVDIVPPRFKSIVVDAVCKIYRRIYYEGIQSEGVDSLSVSFVDDVLAEYDKEFDRYIGNKKIEDDAKSKVLRFR